MLAENDFHFVAKYRNRNHSNTQTLRLATLRNLRKHWCLRLSIGILIRKPNFYDRHFEYRFANPFGKVCFFWKGQWFQNSEPIHLRFNRYRHSRIWHQSKSNDSCSSKWRFYWKETCHDKRRWYSGLQTFPYNPKYVLDLSGETRISEYKRHVLKILPLGGGEMFEITLTLALTLALTIVLTIILTISLTRISWTKETFD